MIMCSCSSTWRTRGPSASGLMMTILLLLPTTGWRRNNSSPLDAKMLPLWYPRHCWHLMMMMSRWSSRRNWALGGPIPPPSWCQLLLCSDLWLEPQPSTPSTQLLLLLPHTPPTLLLLLLQVLFRILLQVLKDTTSRRSTIRPTRQALVWMLLGLQDCCQWIHPLLWACLFLELLFRVLPRKLHRSRWWCLRNSHPCPLSPKAHPLQRFRQRCMTWLEPPTRRLVQIWWT